MGERGREILQYEIGRSQMTSRIFNYQTYSDIDNIHKDYILSVTKETDITRVPLPRINTFLTELDSYYESKER